MKKLTFLLLIFPLLMSADKAKELPTCYQEVDQVIWVVSDLDQTIEAYERLGFSQIKDMGSVEVGIESSGQKERIRLVTANLGGANISWIQAYDEESFFQDFHKAHGDAAMSLVHRFTGKRELKEEIGRLQNLGVEVMEKLTIHTPEGDLHYVLMETQDVGKYILGFTYGEDGLDTRSSLSAENRNHMKLNQYAFAIRDPEPVSAFWKKLGLPELQISYPELGDPMYYGKPADHELYQGWQRHGTIAYEWCIPVKPPIVYEDHINKHGEGIHHLAFSVSDMDQVLDDYTSRGFVVSMGGTWGEEGKPGSGRYEYIDLEDGGGLTMELLWSYGE